MIERFPQYLSAPFQVLWFETDELAIIMLFFIIPLLWGGWLQASMVIIGPFCYTKLKKRYPRGFLRHCFYFIGITNMHGYPTFFQENFLE